MGAIPLVTDGMPSDIDMHYLRHSIEDARAAVLKARQDGVRSYSIAVDARVDAYALCIFGCRNDFVATDSFGLPARLQRACAWPASSSKTDMSLPARSIMPRPIGRRPHRG